MDLLTTGDGSPTLVSPRYREGYHPREGARTQAERLFATLSGVSRLPDPRVIEVGFGLGINFLASLQTVRARGGTLFYLGLEPEPVPVAVLDRVLSGCRLAAGEAERLLLAWERGLDFVLTGEGYLLEVRFVSLDRAELPPGWADAVYYDPFSPKANPAAWSLANLAKAVQALRPGGVLVSYTVAGWVRRNLTRLGLVPDRVPAYGGKRHWLRARLVSGSGPERPPGEHKPA